MCVGLVSVDELIRQRFILTFDLCVAGGQNRLALQSFLMPADSLKSDGIYSRCQEPLNG